MKQLAHDSPYAKPQEAPVKSVPNGVRNVFAAKAAAFMLSFSYACSMLAPQEPVAPARTARLSSAEGQLGEWSFQRLGDGYAFWNPRSGAALIVRSGLLTIRRRSIDTGMETERNIVLGDLNIESLGASPLGGSIVVTVSTWSGREVKEFTLSPAGEQFQMRTFIPQ